MLFSLSWQQGKEGLDVQQSSVPLETAAGPPQQLRMHLGHIAAAGRARHLRLFL
jgi:hypothetical protein